MVTPPSTAAVPSANSPARLTLRGLVLWVVFAATLVTGLVLAVRFGGTVPAMIEEVLR